MKYRILRKGRNYYLVQRRHSWWPFWSTISRYVSGISFPVSSFGSIDAAKAGIKSFKRIAEAERAYKKSIPKTKVVYKE